MSKFADIAATRLATMTLCPGTPAFMSPEALNEPPVYSEKLDSFSLGVVMVQVVIRKFPKPTNRFQTRELFDPLYPTRTVRAQVPVPEVERRHTHISLIDPTHPLLPITLHSLRDEDVERPSSQQLCQTLSALKETDMYEQSSQQDKDQLLRAKDEQILTQTQEIVVKTQQLEAKVEEINAKETVIHELTERLKQSTRDNPVLQNEAETKERQLRRLNQQMESNEEVAAALQHSITQNEREVSELQNVLSSKVDQIRDISKRLEQVDLRGGLHHQQSTVRVTPVSAKRVNLVWENLYLSLLWIFICLLDLPLCTVIRHILVVRIIKLLSNTTARPNYGVKCLHFQSLIALLCVLITYLQVWEDVTMDCSVGLSLTKCTVL